MYYYYIISFLTLFGITSLSLLFKNKLLLSMFKLYTTIKMNYNKNSILNDDENNDNIEFKKILIQDEDERNNYFVIDDLNFSKHLKHFSKQFDLNCLNSNKIKCVVFYNYNNKDYAMVLKDTFENNLKDMYNFLIILKNKNKNESKNKFRSKILSSVIRNTVTKEETDVTNILRQYEGPQLDFYDCMKIKEKVTFRISDIIDINGNQIIPKKYKNYKLYIIDNNADEYSFNYDDIIKY